MKREEALGRVNFEESSAREDLRQILDAPDRIDETLDSLSIDDLANVLTLLVVLFKRVDAKMWERFKDHPLATIRETEAGLAETAGQLRALGNLEPEESE